MSIKMTTTTDHTEIRDSADDDVQSEQCSAHCAICEHWFATDHEGTRAIWDFKPVAEEES